MGTVISLATRQPVASVRQVIIAESPGEPLCRADLGEHRANISYIGYVKICERAFGVLTIGHQSEVAKSGARQTLEWVKRSAPYDQARAEAARLLRIAEGR